MQKVFILEGGHWNHREVYDSLDAALDEVVAIARSTYKDHCLDFYYEGRGNAVVRVRFSDPDRADLTFTVGMHHLKE